MKLLLLLLSALSFSGAAQNAAPAETAAWEQQAKQVTIIRDTWGVPHVYGKTDADCVFGLAYAQAEDNMAQVEDNFNRAIGRGSAVHGKESYVADQLVQAFEFVRLAKEEYQGAPAAMKAIYDAYADGLNYYCHKNPGYGKALLRKFEPWHPLAMIRYFYYVHDILPMVGVSNADLQQHFALDPSTNPTGSNAWAISKAKTRDKTAMLFLNPHRALFGNGTFTEVHVESKSGWKFSGATKFGFPIPYMGHNGKISYGYTVNYPDLGDQYVETFDHPTDSLQYKYGSGYRKAEKWQDTLLIKQGDQIIPSLITHVKTHHGPVVKTLNGKPVAVRLSNIERTGWLEQWYNMSKTSNLAAFRKSIAGLSFPYFNLVYADAKGTIYYLYYVASAKRNKGFDWTKPVDGSNPETEWQGYHRLEELPQLVNPASGFIQTCNSDVEFTSGAGSISKRDFPAYMTGPETHNPRSKRSVALLSGNSSIDFDRWAALTMDVGVQLADDSLAYIVQHLREKAKTAEAGPLIPLIEELEKWDRQATVTSVGMTIFRELMNQHRGLHLAFLPALQKAKEHLEKVYGTWQVPWGERNRLQRLDWDGKEIFSDALPSYPLPGFSQAYGTIFCIIPRGLPMEKDDRKKLYHAAGSSYTSIIEMGKKVRAKSITPFGQQETGPHSADQTPLFINRQYKDAWFYKKDVLKHAERSYHPGG
jgi:acyl-homoserine-lactone acylase